MRRPYLISLLATFSFFAASASGLPEQVNEIIVRVSPDTGSFSYRGVLTRTDFVEVVYVDKDGRKVPEMRRLQEPARSLTGVVYTRQPAVLKAALTPQSVHRTHEQQPFAVASEYHVTPTQSIVSIPGRGTVDQSSLRRDHVSIPHRLPEDLFVYDPDCLREHLWPEIDAAAMELKLTLDDNPAAEELPGISPPPADGHRHFRIVGVRGTSSEAYLVRDVWVDTATGLPTLITSRLRGRLMRSIQYEWSSDRDGTDAPTRVTSRFYSYAMGGNEGVLARESIVEVLRFSELAGTLTVPAAPKADIVLPKYDPSKGPTMDPNDPLSPFGGGPVAAGVPLSEPSAAQQYWLWAALLAGVSIAVLAHAWYSRRRLS